MPSPTMSRRKGDGEKLAPKKSASFHGRVQPPAMDQQQMRRPKTQPDLLAGRKGWERSSPTDAPLLRLVPTKVLVNVTVQRSLGAVQVVASTDWTVRDLVGAVLRQYAREGRRPLLSSEDPSAFGLHYSQFSLECLCPADTLIGLGSRNFFLCPKTNQHPTQAGAASPTPPAPLPSWTCMEAAAAPHPVKKKAATSLPWLKFLAFLS